MSRGNRRHFWTNFLPVSLPVASQLRANARWPHCVSFTQEADCSPLPSPCFPLGSGTLGPPRRVKTARGPSLIVARSASFLMAHRALVLALTGGVGSPQPEPGRLTGNLLPLRPCLVGRATPVAAPAPPQSSPVDGVCRRV